MPFVKRETLCDYELLVRLRIRLLIFMHLTAERNNLMRVYGCNVTYTWLPFHSKSQVLVAMALLEMKT